MVLADEIELPSGKAVTFHDVIWGEPGPAGLTVRFRFLDPDLAATIDELDFDGMEADTAFLCETYALERITEMGPQPQQIIVSIADREVPFGEPAPEAAQIFEAYAFDGETCTWEGF
ncbi:acetolactate synthase [Maritimibacter sp. DP4N28-5]|uniref:Acetolactate synthase n=1 Tax=Maritimibacter dapengensis TaxID=2836868 RepID=A0ABS6T089_9RHOB|nr:acetolactate synthase [Maritimibacter dapengensis]